MDFNWATDDQRECIELLVRLFRGEHHLTGKIKPFGRGIQYIVGHHSFSTFDYSRLTRLVILAHDMCIRAEIAPRSFNYLSIELFKRQREGQMHERHPTMEEAIQKERSS